MSDQSVFESRRGEIRCSEKELFMFLTDLRNFKRFIPEGTLTEVEIERDSCSFNVNMMGKVKIRIAGKLEFSEVVYSGYALQVNEFSLSVRFRETGNGLSEAVIYVTAALNPLLKMIAAEPINRFLETLISEMEKFRGWNEISGDIQIP